MNLHELSLIQLAASIGRREVSPVELTRALLERVRSLEPQLQAWETLDEDGALAAAGTLERELMTMQGRRSPLHGIPVGVKDIYHVAGLPTIAGFRPYAGRRAAQDAETVSQLRAGGAIILGKTVTTQFAFTDPARTRNPWHPDRTPGGSSSGSAAAVAGRMVPAALGTQTAGSVLRPAAFCGVVGFKPSYDLLSRRGILPLSWSLDHVGVIVRSVEDAALLTQTLVDCELESRRRSGKPADSFWPLMLADDRAPVLGVVRDFMERAEPVVAGHVQGVARALEQQGAIIEETRLPEELATILAVHRILMQVEVAAVHASGLELHREAYAPVLRAYVEVGQLLPAQAYVQAQRLRRRMRTVIGDWLTQFDALVLPTVSSVVPGRETTGDPSYQAPWTLLGLPAISLPSGLDDAGLPMAIQLVATPFGERRLLRAAAWCERRLPAMPAPAFLTEAL